MTHWLDLRCRLGRSGIPWRVLAAVGALLAVTCMAVMTGLAMIAAAEDQDEFQHSQTLAATALGVRTAEMARTIKDYANWADAYEAIHLRQDLEWALADNLSSNMFDNLGLDEHYVVLGDGRIWLGMTQGERQPPGQGHGLSHGFEELLTRARSASGLHSEPFVGLVLSRGGPAIVGVAALAPSIRPEILDRQGTPTVLAIVRRLSPELVSQIGRDYLLDGLRLEARAAAAAMPLVAVDGSSLGGLAWNQPRPGWELVSTALPILFAALALVAICTGGILCRQHRRQLAKLETATAALVESESRKACSEGRFRDFAEIASDWLWETDEDDRFTYISERHGELLGLSVEERLGKTRWELSAPTEAGQRAKWDAFRAAVESRQTVRDFRFTTLAGDGRLLHLKISGKPVFDEAGRFTGYRGTGSDITSEVETAEQLRRQAMHDGLTGLANRSAFSADLTAVLADTDPRGAPTAVLCLDLDRFKEVNDTLGHAAGDELLRQASRRLQGALREGDLLARFGGDEFTILLRQLVDVREVVPVAERLVAELARPFRLGEIDMHVGVSIGIAMAPDDGQDADLLLKHADIALYRAKHDGRGTYRFFEPAMDARLKARRELECELRDALAQAALEIRYQPQIELESGTMRGMEALVRWVHPDHGPMPPAEFVQLAEETGLIVPLGEYVLREACRQAARWPGQVLAVNLSAVQFRRADIVGSVAAILRETGMPAERLELEITETALLREDDAALATMKALKALGVRMALDDFGTGYSSLSYLQRYPFDKIKIDRSFVEALGQNRRSVAIVRAVVALARGLGLEITAEGVETAHQLAFLTAEGCDLGQGFLFAPALTAAEIERRCGVSLRMPGRPTPLAA